MCQVKGVGFWFQFSTQAVMSAARALTLRCAERCSFLVVSAENQRSTWLSHDDEVGVELADEIDGLLAVAGFADHL